MFDIYVLFFLYMFLVFFSLFYLYDHWSKLRTWVYFHLAAVRSQTPACDSLTYKKQRKLMDVWTWNADGTFIFTVSSRKLMVEVVEVTFVIMCLWRIHLSFLPLKPLISLISLHNIFFQYLTGHLNITNLRASVWAHSCSHSWLFSAFIYKLKVLRCFQVNNTSPSISPWKY